MRRFALIVVTCGLCSMLCLLWQEAIGNDNLLRNPSFEQGNTTPKGWTMFSPPSQGMSRGITYTLDDTKYRSGKRSVSVQSTAGGIGMWQQVVDLEPGQVYVFTGYVAFEQVSADGGCCLQLVFRDGDNRILQFVYLPSHTGTRDFAFDFPPKLKVRAPAEAARAEVNLFLRGRGKVWFDDVFFGPAPTGEISGTVACQGEPVEGARIYVWGDPWGKMYETFPMTTEPPSESLKADNAYWTNHPECVRRTWVERITNPSAEGTERWFHIEFDLTSMLAGGITQSSRAPNRLQLPAGK